MEAMFAFLVSVPAVVIIGVLAAVSRVMPVPVVARIGIAFAIIGLALVVSLFNVLTAIFVGTLALAYGFGPELCDDAGDQRRDTHRALA
jgi:hypothetical protein